MHYYEQRYHSLNNKLNTSYEVIDPDDKTVIGKCIVQNSVISLLEYDSTKDLYYKGQILGTLLENVCKEADAKNAKLLLMLSIENDNLKYFIERYGFRYLNNNIMERTPGSIIPNGASIPGM